jgi:hypothetical protein
MSSRPAWATQEDRLCLKNLYKKLFENVDHGRLCFTVGELSGKDGD